jgi:aldehyde dehydrogenase (NAD+)
MGPVVAISRFTSGEQIIHEANNTIYGLIAWLHTKDYERAVRIINVLQTGNAWVNLYSTILHSIPFGGYSRAALTGSAAPRCWRTTRTASRCTSTWASRHRTDGV